MTAGRTCSSRARTCSTTSALLTPSRSYAEPNAVFRNLGDGKFEDVSATAGADFQIAAPHRGVAFGDLDNDGRIDTVVTALGEPARIFHNVSGGSESLAAPEACRHKKQSHGHRSAGAYHYRRRPFAVERGHDFGGLRVFQR